MPNRTAKFASAVLASFLAGAPLATVSHSAAGAVDDCLSGPKGQTPQGAHWYYRIDHATKRHCWYLADERAPQTAAPNSSASTKPAPQDADATMQQSVANARAELPAQPRIEPSNRNGGIAPALSADTVRTPDSGDAITPQAPPSQSVVASRWPDPSGAESSTNPLPNRPDPGIRPNPVSQDQSTSILAASPFAAADVSSETPSYSLQMQLAALMGVLALAGITGAAIFKIRNSQRLLPSEIRRRRGPIWESTDDDRIVLSRHPGAHGFARGFDQAADRSDRVAEFFAQISRRAPT
jgi:hypothetical protein